MTLRVVIVAEKAGVRQGLRTALEGGGCVIVGECAGGPEAVALALSTDPEVVVLGGATADQAELELLRRVRSAVPSARIVVRSSCPAAEVTLVTMEAGADECVETSDDAGLVAAVARAAGPEWSASGGPRFDDRQQPSCRGTRYRVLVVDDDPTAKRLVHLSLEMEGAEVMEVASLSEARASLGQRFDGFVLDRQLPDGDGLDLLPVLAKRYPQASVVVCSNLNDHVEPWSVVHVPKTDMEGVVSALGLVPGGHPDVPVETRLTVDVAGPASQAGGLPKRRKKKMVVAELLVGLGLAKAAFSVTAAAAAVTAVGAAGALLGPAQHAVATGVEALTPFSFPDEADDKADFGSTVSTDASHGGVDGATVSAEAKLNGDVNRLADPAADTEPDTGRPAAPGQNGLDRANQTPAAGHVTTAVPSGGPATARTQSTAGLGTASSTPAPGRVPTAVPAGPPATTPPAGAGSQSTAGLGTASSTPAAGHVPTTVPPNRPGR